MKRTINSKMFLIICGILFTSVGVYAAKIYYATDFVHNIDDNNVSLNRILNDLYAGKCENYNDTSDFKYNSNEVIYNSSDGENITVNEALAKLYNKKCGFSTKVKLGDYVIMTPTSTSFTTNTSMTGYSKTQTLNPSELNLWRVIKINDDGTIEVVSQYASSTYVYFYGPTGYKNFVGYLNVIASQYKNDKYTTGSRIMGYNGQTQYLPSTSKLTQTSSPPWKCNTGSCTTESQGGGDNLHTADTNLVKSVLGTLVANKAGTTSTAYYWLGSRYYNYDTPEDWDFNVRYVNTSGSIINDYRLINFFDSISYRSLNAAIRPILTLKSGLTATGSGTSSNPYVLN